MALTSLHTKSRSLLGDVAAATVGRFDQIAVTLFGHHFDDSLPHNVERHGEQLLVRLPVPAEPDPRFPTGTGHN